MSLVSVIMPAYNAGDFINEAIESILKQTYKEWNLTIVNDGSVDNTKELIEEYTKKYPDKINLISKEQNEGTANALNILIKSVSGKYICWLSADDLYTPDMLKESVEFLEKNDQFDLVFSDYETINENSEFVQKSVFKKVIEELKEGKIFQPYKHLLTSGHCIHGCTVMAKSFCFREVGGFNPKYKYAHDYDIWLRMASIYNIGYIDKVHVRGREYNKQISKQGNNEIDSIDVLFDFIHNKEMFTKLYRKSEFNNENETLYALIIGQLKLYKHKEKEFDHFVKKLFDNNDKLFDNFKISNNGKELLKIISKMKEEKLYISEEFFEDDTKGSYLHLLCKLNNLDAFIINNQAIRFDRFRGNSLERFNKGLMRSNDIVIGNVRKDVFLKFTSENSSEYRYLLENEDKEKLSIGISYFMYKKTEICEKLHMEQIIDTSEDIWWQLCRYIISKID